MKKILIIAGLMLFGINAIASNTEYTYSPTYIQHLKTCAKYTDEYTTAIQTGDETSPVLNIKSTEEILGWLNTKCITKSTTFSIDLGENILVTKCALSRAQVNSLVQKMKDVNQLGTKEARKALQDEMTKMIEDEKTCKIKNYLE